MWPQYNKGYVTESDLVTWSVNQFQFHRSELEKPHPEDMTEDAGKKIIEQVLKEHQQHLDAKKAFSEVNETNL
jgi:hypothetical protein